MGEEKDKYSPITVFCCCSQADPSSLSTSGSADHSEHTDSVPTDEIVPYIS